MIVIVMMIIITIMSMMSLNFTKTSTLPAGDGSPLDGMSAVARYVAK